MMDIVETLFHAKGDRASYNVADDTVRVKCNDLHQAIREIESLRAQIAQLSRDSINDPLPMEKT